MKAAEEISQLLDDHIVMTQAMSFSPYKKPFENRIMNWESKLRMTQDVMEEWATCQRAWLYLEPIFSSEDINRSVEYSDGLYLDTDRYIGPPVCFSVPRPAFYDLRLFYKIISSSKFPHPPLLSDNYPSRVSVTRRWTVCGAR